MSEARKVDAVPTGTEGAPAPFLSCKTAEDLRTLEPQDPTIPLVIYGDGELQGEKSGELAARMRARGIKNPLVYYVPSRTVKPNERVQFLDAGGDVLVDARDVGPKTKDPNQDVVLQIQVRSLLQSARERAGVEHTKTYEFGITHNLCTASFLANGQRLMLTPYEYKVLEGYFSERGDTSAETRVPIEALSRHVYEDELYDRHKEALRSAIMTLNKKLKAHGVRLRGMGVHGQPAGYELVKT